ncbi:MAG: energy transducer TonB [Bacteroidota bacterium]|nr:energy transducer TonB [Bacteroidota bacterium]
MKLGIHMSISILISLALQAAAQQLPQQSVTQCFEFTAEQPSISVDETTYFVYKDGQFTESMLTKSPELIGGKDLMSTLITLNIRYPDKAREKKIGGTVFVSVVIDAEGNLEDAFIHEGIGGGCNDEALRAVRLLDATGFEPGEIKGKPVTVKYDIPITFLPR